MEKSDMDCLRKFFNFLQILIGPLSCLTYESPGLEPDWFEEINLFSIRNPNILSNVTFSICIFSQIGSNETSR